MCHLAVFSLKEKTGQKPKDFARILDRSFWRIDDPRQAMLHSSCWVYATPKKLGSTISTESYMRKSTPKNWQVASPLVKIGFLQFFGVVSKWLWQTPLKSPSTGRWEIADFVSGEGGSKESHAEHGDVFEWSGTRGPPLKTLTSLVMVGKRSFVFFLMVDGWSLQL